MTLVVETGAGLPNANSYASVAEADAWAQAISDPTWPPLSVAEKERHLILGSAYVDNAEIYPYSGIRMTPAQAFQWPRSGATYTGGLDVPPASVPPQIVRAAVVAALMSASKGLPTQSTATAGGREIKREKVDVIEVEYFHSTEGKDSKTSTGEYPWETYGHPDVTGLVMPLIHADALSQALSTGSVGVPRSAAARRGTAYLPSSTPPSFSRGQMDAIPFFEDFVNYNRRER